MRYDMFKVIVERARRGSHTGPGHYFRAAKRFTLDEDLEVTDKFVGRKLAMNSRKYGAYKDLNENLSPLRRFLHSRLGHRWDDVYSEICEHINVNSTVQQHVLGHIEDFIEIKTYFEDGRIYYVDRYSDRNLVEYTNYYRRIGGLLYVHPVTGLITLEKTSGLKTSWGLKREEVARKIRESERRINKYLCFKRENGLWFRNIYVDLPKSDRELFEKQIWPMLASTMTALEKSVVDPFLEYKGAARARNRRSSHPDGVVYLKSESASKHDIKRYQLK